MRILQSPSTWWRFLLLLLLIFGVYVRFTNLGDKVYWHDEVFTSLRTAGYTGEEVVGELFNSRIVTVEDLQKYQRLSPEKHLRDTLAALKTHPEHPPLYYLLVWCWRHAFGSSVTAIRSLSAVISLLVFPCLYWFCRTLFSTPFVGEIAIALMAVSPVHLLYAQEARQYSLWTVTVLLACLALCRALQQQTFTAWGTYALSLALNFYTSLLSLLLAIAHGIYIFTLCKFRWNLTTKNYTLASIAGAIAFLPWIGVLLEHWWQFNQKTGWVEASVPLSFLVKLWGLHLSSAFVDLGFKIEQIYTYLVPPVILILVIYALSMTYFHNSRTVGLFILLLTAVPAIALIFPDVLLGGQRSSQTRYFIPSLLGVQIAVADLLSRKITYSRAYQRKIWSGILAILIVLGMVSCSLIIRADTWWNKGVSYANIAIAKAINLSPQPLVIADVGQTTLGNLLSLSYLLEPKVRLQLFIELDPSRISTQFSDIFLFYPSESFQKELQAEKRFRIVSLEQEGVPLLQLIQTDKQNQ